MRHRPPWNSSMTYGRRDGCPSDRHDTARARQQHRCCCPLAIKLRQENERRYRQGPAGRARARRLARESSQAGRQASARQLAYEMMLGKVLRYTRLGWGVGQIAKDLLISERVVNRYRAVLRQRGDLPATEATRQAAALAALGRRQRVPA